MKATVKVEGLAQLERNLKNFQSGVLKELEPAARSAGEMVAEVAKQKVHRDKTGKMRRGIDVRGIDIKKTSVAVHVGPHQKQFYARWVEYGHKLKRSSKGQVIGNVPAYPFLRPAYDETKTRAQDLIRNALARLIERWR